MTFRLQKRAFSTLKSTSRTSKLEISSLFSIFVGNFPKILVPKCIAVADPHVLESVLKTRDDVLLVVQPHQPQLEPQHLQTLERKFTCKHVWAGGGGFDYIPVLKRRRQDYWGSGIYEPHLFILKRKKYFYATLL
jgi:hypothetical protein